MLQHNLFVQLNYAMHLFGPITFQTGNHFVNSDTVSSETFHNITNSFRNDEIHLLRFLNDKIDIENFVYTCSLKIIMLLQS